MMPKVISTEYTPFVVEMSIRGVSPKDLYQGKGSVKFVDVGVDSSGDKVDGATNSLRVNISDLPEGCFDLAKIVEFWESQRFL